MSAIPTTARARLRARDRDRCLRCGMAGHHWHHRRSRRRRDDHQHCSCVGVTLCPTCHAWAHANPSAATETGWIIPVNTDQPWLIPAKTYAGWFTFGCDGSSAAHPGPPAREPVE